MKRLKFYAIVIGIVLISYFSVDIYHGIQGLFVSKRGVEATKLTQTRKGSATTFVVNGSSSSADGGTVGSSNGTAGSDDGTASDSSYNFNEADIKASITPTLNNIFTKAVECQNKTHVNKDSGKVQPSFDKKIIDDATFNNIVTGMSIETSSGSTTIIINGKAKNVNNKDGKYSFTNVVISDIAQQGSFAQITGTFNYTVDKGNYSKQFSAFTDTSYTKITEINMQ